MNEYAYTELTNLLEQMINDNVQLIHGGHIIKWEETRIPEVLQKIKENLAFSNKHIVQNIPIVNNVN